MKLIRQCTRRCRPLMAGVAVIALLAPSVGCGDASAPTDGTAAAGGESDANAGVIHAREQIAKHSRLVTSFSPPGPSIPDVAELRGKTVWYVPVYLPAALFESSSHALKAALAEVGVNLQVCDGRANPSDVSSCITRAVGAGAAGVITDAISFELAPQAYQSAAKAKVPVLALDNDEPVPSKFGDMVRTMSIDVDKQARLAADVIIADSNAEANVLFLELLDSEHTKFAAEHGTKPEFREHCPGCKLQTVTSTAPEVQKVPSLISTSLIKDPNIDYVSIQFDATAPAVLQGIGQVGRRNQIKYVSTTAELAGMQRVKSGQQLADVANDVAVQAWNASDALMRMILGMKPARDYTLPIRVFDKETVERIDLTPAALERGDWYSDGSFREMYRKLWGID